MLHAYSSLTTNRWKPIGTAPKDGTWIVGKRGGIKRRTQWGKTSHVPMYGWVYVADHNGGDPEYDLWEPTTWSHALAYCSPRFPDDK